MTADRTDQIRRYIDRSSFNSPAARKVRARTPATVTEYVLRAVTTSPTKASRDDLPARSLTSPQQGDTSSATSRKEPSMSASRRTSASAAKAASRVLRDGRTSRSSKTAAGSALSQRAPKNTPAKKGGKR